MTDKLIQEKMMNAAAKRSALEKEALRELITYVRTVWSGVEFRLFGSRARGTGGSESDLDILIMLPCEVKEEIRRRIVHKVFDINLSHETNISSFIVSAESWKNGMLSLLPIHRAIEDERIERCLFSKAKINNKVIS